jgi:hypothetical protein
VDARVAQIRRGDLSDATDAMQEGRLSTGRNLFGLEDGDATHTAVGSTTDSAFSTLRRLAKVVISLGQVLASFTRVCVLSPSTMHPLCTRTPRHASASLSELTLVPSRRCS